MIAETANLTTARNVVKEAASDHNRNGRNRHRINGADVMEAAMSRREPKKVSRCLTQRLSGEQRPKANLKVAAYGGPR
jgi:hypothetical protein